MEEMEVGEEKEVKRAKSYSVVTRLTFVLRIRVSFLSFLQP